MQKTARPFAGVFIVAIGSMVAAFALAGCPSKKPQTAACKTDKECKNGNVCVANKCVECGSDTDCKKGQTCKANACVSKPECTKDSECSDGKVCQAGACKPCSADAECGAGGTCANGACKRATACKTDEQCADDEDCVDGFCKRPWKDPNGGTATCSLTSIYFGYDDSSVMASERDRLDANASCIEKTKDKAVGLIGHTDNSGTEEYNIALSERRAQAVADYLARLGVDPARLVVVPKGETESSGQGDDKDRRVEFMWR
jgi:peptidoglycan-associated lipoprotein